MWDAFKYYTIQFSFNLQFTNYRKTTHRKYGRLRHLNWTLNK